MYKIMSKEDLLYYYKQCKNDTHRSVFNNPPRILVHQRQYDNIIYNTTLGAYENRTQPLRSLFLCGWRPSRISETNSTIMYMRFSMEIELLYYGSCACLMPIKYVWPIDMKSCNNFTCPHVIEVNRQVLSTLHGAL